MYKRILTSFLLSVSITFIYGQPDFPDEIAFFNTESINRIDVYVDQDSLDIMIAELDKENPLSATVHIESGGSIDIINQVGFRLRGNTSLMAPKKSWKLDFNEFIKGQKYEGLEKLNLKGMHNDPTLVRSKLCWDLFRNYNIPAPRASFTELYINGDNYGVFCSVEHIDEEFIESRFDNKSGNLYKCTWPSDLSWQGSNPNNYTGYGYELKTNEDENNISDLIEFIGILNNSIDLECELEDVFNVNSYLKVMAIDVFTGNWDGPIFNKNNFYLYHNSKTGLLEYIPYDLDNTWGIDWLGQDWGTRNIYSWSNNSEPRPIFTRIMAIEKYRDRFSEYMARIITHVDNNDYIEDVNDIALVLAGKVSADPYYPLTYGYTFNDFLNSFMSPISGGASSHDDDYGIYSYISTRSNSAEVQLDPSWNFYPMLSYMDIDGGYLEEDLTMTILAEDDWPSYEVWLDYTVNQDGAINSISLNDEGISPDTLASDGIFTGSISSLNVSLLEGQFRVEDSDQNISYFPCEHAHLRDLEDATHELYINEFMAFNTSYLMDEAGEYDDWIEIFNGGSSDLYIGNFYLTDNFEIPNKWKLPNITLEAGEHYIIWADKDEEQGFNHANFKLESAGEELAIFEPIVDHYKPIELIRYTDAEENMSYGYLPDASQPIVVQSFPTPGTANGEEVDSGISILSESAFSISPNPSNSVISIDGTLVKSLDIYDIQFRKIKSSNSNTLDIHDLSSGVYFISVIDVHDSLLPLEKFIRE